MFSNIFGPSALDKARHELSSATEQLSVATNALKDSQRREAALQEAIGCLRVQAAAQKKEVAQAGLQHEQHVQELQELVTSKDATIQSLKAQIRDGKKREEELTAQCQDARVLHGALERKHSQLENDHEGLQLHCEELKQQVVDATVGWKELQKKHGELKQNMIQATAAWGKASVAYERKQKTESQQREARAEEQRIQLEATVEELQHRIGQLEADIERKIGVIAGQAVRMNALANAISVEPAPGNKRPRRGSLPRLENSPP